MAARILPSAFFTILLLWQSVLAVEVKLFYSPLKDACAWGGANSFPAGNHTANGGVCAYVPSRNRLFACPAGSPTCWGFNVNCLGGTTETAGTNQILCGASNSRQWCCGEAESCTTTPNQINVCLSDDIVNINAKVSPADAAAKEYAALPSASIVTNLPQNTPSVFSTVSPTTASTSRASGSTSSKSVASNASVTNTATAGGAAGDKNGGSTNGGNSGGGISGGAIAGIVIGAIAGILAIVGLVAFLLMRKRRQNKAVGPDGGMYEKPNDTDHIQSSPYPASATTAVDSSYNPTSYGHDTYAKFGPEPVPQELSADSHPHELPTYTKSHELP